jgi:hypothetical protein
VTAVQFCTALCCLTFGGAAVPYAGPDRNHTLPDISGVRQFSAEWDRSHQVCLSCSAERRARHGNWGYAAGSSWVVCASRTDRRQLPLRSPQVRQAGTTRRRPSAVCTAPLIRRLAPSRAQRTGVRDRRDQPPARQRKAPAAAGTTDAYRLNSRQTLVSSSISVTSAAIGDLSDRVNVM